MLSDLLEVCQRLLLPLHDRRHSSQSCPLELFTAVQRVSKFEQADIVFRDLGDEVTGSVELTQGEFVVVLVVEHVEEGGEKRVEVLRNVSSSHCSRLSELTSSMGNSEMIRPSFSSNVSWVYLTLRM